MLDFRAKIDIANNYNSEESAILLEADVLEACQQIPPESVSLIITSPPYNLGKNYEKQITLENYLAWQTTVLEQLTKLLTPTGNLCWQVGNYVEDGETFPLDMYFYPLIKKLGLKLRNRLIWHFEHGLHASHRFSGRYETLLWFTKGDSYTFNLDAVRVPSKYPGKLHYKGEKKGQPSGNPLGKNPSDFWTFLAAEWDNGIWEIPNVKANHPEKTEHPCQFPVELAERCVLALSNENDWILDPFAGVGSSLIAGLKNKRRVIGIERDKTYCDISRARITALSNGTLKLRPLGKPVHQPSGREKVAKVPGEWISPAGSTYQKELEW